MCRPVMPAPDEMVMTRPKPRSHMPLITAREQCSTPNRLTLMAPRHPAGSLSRNWTSPMPSAPPFPALLTRMSTVPTSAIAATTAS